MGYARITNWPLVVDCLQTRFVDALRMEDLEEVTEVKADSKNRISLGRKVRSSVRHYQDRASGRIVLEPVALISLSQPWLNDSPKAKASVERGLADAKAGRLEEAPEDFSKYTLGK
jgi:hypothetical protein